MTAIHVRDVPDPVLASLRERARRHGHSMQQELRQILEAAAAMPQDGDPVEPIRLVTTRTIGASSWPREEVYDDTQR